MTKRLFIFILVLILILILRLFLFYSQKTEYKDGQDLSFETTLLSDPKFFSNFQNLSVNLPTGELIFIKTTDYPEYNYGERFLIIGPIRILPRQGGAQSNEVSNPLVRVLSNKNVVMSMNFPKIELVKNSENYLLAVVNSVRQKIINQFQMILPKDSASLLLGIVFGIKEDFSKDFLSSLKTVGVMHVIAASGMNVTMVSGFFFYLFALFFKRQKAIILSFILVLFYDFLAGFQASIIRASIMAMLAFSAQVLGRQRDGLYALFLTAWVMLFLSPSFLTDVGFQLSFASTLGILVIPKLFKRFKNGISSDLITTFSAQVATLPILLGSFGTYSIWSVVVNALVLWTVPILMILGGFAAIVLFVFAPIAKLLLYLCLPFLVYFEFIANFFGNLNNSITIQNLPWQISAAYYPMLIAVIIFIAKRSND
jgi:ComEC/Rec2-related protein